MSLRHEWVYRYPVSELLAASKTKLDHHKSRLAWWQNKKEETFQKVKEGGIEVHESIVAQYAKTGYSNTGSHSATIMVDQTLQKDLNECAAKIVEHSGKINEYSAFVQVLSNRPADDRYDLELEDWLYFFGK